MANLQIKDLPDDLHEELRRRARIEGISIRDYVLRMIRHDQAYPSKAEWAALVDSSPPLPMTGDVAAQIRADREERSAHLEEVLRRSRESAASE